MAHATPARPPCQVSEDAGDTWRVLDPENEATQNSIYSFAFDPARPDRVFIAAATYHDWPRDWYAGALEGKRAPASGCSFSGFTAGGLPPPLLLLGACRGGQLQRGRWMDSRALATCACVAALLQAREASS